MLDLKSENLLSCEKRSYDIPCLFEWKWYNFIIRRKRILIKTFWTAFVLKKRSIKIV